MNYKLIKEAFYKTYKSYMDFLRLTNPGNEMFYILVLRRQLKDNLTNVDIVINSMNANIDGYNYKFKNNAILKDSLAKELVEEIREDFQMHHYISYCTVNTSDSIQRIQNTNYSLNIKLLNDVEEEEALLFNQKINTDKERHKALIRK